MSDDLMPGATITFRVDDRERADFVRRAASEKVNLSDYIRVRLGLRELGSEADADIDIDPRHQLTLHERIADHESRLLALEANARS